MLRNKKHLGQHWLKNPEILSEIAALADIKEDDHILEVGPGLGTLTSRLLKKADSVTAVEFDSELARKLPGQFPGKNLHVVNEDILQFDLNQLPAGYKVVSNVPYYITNKIIHKLLQAQNQPSSAVLLVQKEVAERLASGPGEMSVLAIAAQVFARIELGIDVPRQFFTPPPKVDSQVVVLHMRRTPLVASTEQKEFFRVVKAGFSAKRKKLRSSLAGGLGMDKMTVEKLLKIAEISPHARAEDLSIRQWQKLMLAVKSIAN